MDFKFSTLKYERPDFKKVGEEVERIVAAMKKASSYEELKKFMGEYEVLINHMQTQATIASIRHTLDTTDEFYEKEDEVINNEYPVLMPKLLAFDEAIMNSPYRADVEKEYGKQYFSQMELQ